MGIEMSRLKSAWPIDLKASHVRLIYKAKAREKRAILALFEVEWKIEQTERDNYVDFRKIVQFLGTQI